MVKAVGYLRPFVDGSHYFRGVGDHPRTVRLPGIMAGDRFILQAR